MALVILKAVYASPILGCHQPGDIIEVDNPKDLVNGGFATLVEVEPTVENLVVAGLVELVDDLPEDVKLEEPKAKKRR